VFANSLKRIGKWRMMGECGALPLACQWQMANAKTIVA
jgi:hypothetical protein